MTREEAIEVLKKNRPGADPRRCGQELCTAVDVAIAALREQEEYEILKNSYAQLQEIFDGTYESNMAMGEELRKRKWISVKDALPVINDNEPLGEFVEDRGYTFIVSDGEYIWTELFWLKANKFDDESVTHWMPMPTVPPKEEV